MDFPVSDFHKHVSSPGKLDIQDNFPAEKIFIKFDAFIKI